MTSGEIRQAYLDFFTSSPRNHKRIDAAPLVLHDDPTTLFTSAGMQPLVPYLKGEPHPSGSKRLVNSQPSFRTQDIEEVGDNRHITFFEMLGNWSFGDYFKDEQLFWVWEFLTKELGLSKERLFVTIFEGAPKIPKDEESEKIWRSFGVSDDHIRPYDASKNWWSRSGNPDQMSIGDIGGPDSEIFFDLDPSGTRNIHAQALVKDTSCHPNCPCGRFLEIGNSVFIQYVKNADESLSALPQKNVDFGGGLERLTAASNDDPDIFNIDLFLPIIQKIEEVTNQKYSDERNKSSIRVIADHIRTATFLIVDGVIPSNKAHGYVLRRLLRRASVKFASLRNNPGEHLPPDLITTVLKLYDGMYTIHREKQESGAYALVEEEIRKFQKTMHVGLKVLQKMNVVDGQKAFDLYQTYGFPLEVTIELLQQRGKSLEIQDFQREFRKHQELSRKTSAGMFKGGLASHTPTTTKYHTATHLLHQALRDALGSHVVQKGSNITDERLRFDFHHDKAMTDEEVRRVEEIVNQKIKKDLQVTSEKMTVEEAKKAGAIGLFPEKYDKRVTVYSIGDYSKEMCGGPHVSHTGEIGRVKIIKEEPLGSSLRRIRAVLTP